MHKRCCLFEEFNLRRVEVGRPVPREGPHRPRAAWGVGTSPGPQEAPVNTGSRAPSTTPTPSLHPGPMALLLLRALALATPEAPGRSTGDRQGHRLLWCNEWLLLGVCVS